MKQFSLELGNGTAVTGLQATETQRSSSNNNNNSTDKGRPLLVCIHGGSYDASYFDATPEHSVSRTANALCVPVVAINRAGTGDSTALPLPKNEGTDTAIQNQATWLHEMVLPAVWREFGKRSGATSMVLLCHSFGATIGIATAALHAARTNTDQPAYPLCGLILSAFAHKTKPLPDLTFTPGPELDNSGNPTTLIWPQDALDEIMLNASHSQTSPQILSKHAAMTGPISIAEMTDMSLPGLWQSYWREKAKAIRVPVLCGVGDADAMVDGSEEVMREFVGAFERAERTEHTELKGAPHSIELSWYSPAWYVRCCGFALEFAVGAEMR